jgi:hypothetical protein
MSRDDLLADLQGEVSARPAAPPTPLPARSGLEQGPGTPALDISWTPLRWSLPSVRPASRGTGVAVRLGPVKVSFGVR